MKRLFGVAMAVALVAGLSGAAMARWAGQGQQGGPCGDCPQQVQKGAMPAGGAAGDCSEHAAATGRGFGTADRERDCDGPCGDDRGGRGSARMGRDRGCDGPCADGRDGRGMGRRGHGRHGRDARRDGPCRDGEDQDGRGAGKAKVSLDEAKAQAKAFVEQSLKGATLKGIEESPRGRRFPHYLGTVEQGGRLYAILIDATNGGIRGLRLLPGTAPAK